MERACSKRFEFAHAALLDGLQGLFDHLREVAIVGRVEFHLFQGGALEVVEDGFGAGARRGQFADQLVELLDVEDLDFGGELLDALGVDVIIQQLADLLFVVAEIDHFGVAQFDRHAQVVEELQVAFVGLDLAFGRGLVESSRTQGNLERAGIGGQGIVEDLAHVFGFEEALHRFGVVSVDALENSPQVRVALREFLHFGGHVCNRAGHVFGIEVGQGVIGLDGVVQFAQDAAIVDHVAEFLAVEETVDARDGLQDGVILERLVDVEHGVARLVEADQQFIDHDQQVDAIGAVEVFDDFAVVGFFAAEAFHDSGPEALHFGQVVAFDVFVAFTRIGGGDDHFAGQQAAFVQVFLVAQGHGFVGGGKLGLEAEAFVLEVAGKMLGQVVGDLHDAPVGVADHIFAAHLALQVGLLLVAQPGGVTLEPAVELGLVRFQFDQAAFVQQRDNGLVVHGLAHGIFVDEAAELEGGGLLAFGERRAGEADVAGVREDLAHLAVDQAVLAAMALVHQDKNVGVIVGDLFIGHGLELVDDGGDDVGFVRLDQFDQVPSRFGLHDGLAAVLEGAVDLIVEVDAVGDQQDARVGDVGMQRQGFGQHDHAERLARAGGVPDDAAGALALRIQVGDAFDGGFDGEVLLVTGDLLDPAVEEHELVGQFEQAGRVEQAQDGTVLLGEQAFALVRKLTPHPIGMLAPVVEGVFDFGRERLVDQRAGRGLRAKRGLLPSRSTRISWASRRWRRRHGWC